MNLPHFYFRLNLTHFYFLLNLSHFYFWSNLAHFYFRLNLLPYNSIVSGIVKSLSSVFDFQSFRLFLDGCGIFFVNLILRMVVEIGLFFRVFCQTFHFKGVRNGCSFGNMGPAVGQLVKALVVVVYGQSYLADLAFEAGHVPDLFQALYLLNIFDTFTTFGTLCAAHFDGSFFQNFVGGAQFF